MIVTPSAAADLSVTLSFPVLSLFSAQSFLHRFATDFSIGSKGYVTAYRSTAHLAGSQVCGTVACDSCLRIVAPVSVGSVSVADSPVRLNVNFALVTAPPARAHVTA